VIVLRLIKRSILGLAASAVLLLALGTAVASASSAWWHLTTGVRPGYLNPGSERDDVQDVTVNATAGTFVLARLSASQVQEGKLDNEHGEPQYVELPYNATHEQVQSSLGTIYGAGNVQVTGSGAPYEITFKGTLADQLIETVNTQIPGKPTPLQGSINAKQITEGRPAGEIYVTAENVGDTAIESEATVQIKDTLPHGLRAVAISANRPYRERSYNRRVVIPCSLATLTCTVPEPAEEPLEPFYPVEERIQVVAEPGLTNGALNEAVVTGGATPSASIKRPIRVSAAPTPFGVEDYEVNPEEAGGVPATQAGVHPFQLTTTITLNQNADSKPNDENQPVVYPAGLTKDFNVKLPAGLVGNPSAIARCTATQFEENPAEAENGCPADSAIGVAVVTVNEPLTFGVIVLTEPLFNLVPRVGEPARFAFYVPVANVPVYLDTSVRSGGDYGVTVNVNNITEETALLSSEVTVWGVPGDSRHDHQRGWGCLLEESNYTPHAPCEPSQTAHPPAFLQLPTSCTGPLQSSLESDSWEEPTPAGQQLSLRAEPMPEQDGCNRLPFAPSLKVTPDGTAGSTPTGLTVDVHNPQEGSLNATGLAEPDIKDITVALPEGVTINPAGADGLEACSTGQVGYLSSPGAGSLEGLAFTPELAQPFCPDSSKIGTAKIKTPLLPDPLEGAVYLAAQNANPFGTLVAMYLVAQDPISGTLVKLAGEVRLTDTGQIVATFHNNPQLPFEDAELHFFGGERAPLALPARCGEYTTHASFTPWTGEEAAAASSSFHVTSGPNGSACPGAALPFAPSLTAGMTSIQAGGFSPFTMTMSREDGNQDLQAVQLHMPPGLLGTLSSVKLCSEPQADLGTCGAESLIGHTVVSVGLGGSPFSVTGGEVFITGPYRGAPYGLSIVNPAKAGPFDLGKVVVRAKIEVDPTSAALTITTDPSGPYSIPHILDGIPLQIKHVNVTIDRSSFTFNPTNCSKLAITGSLTSTQEATSALSVPFQATNCAVLAFKPKLTAKTSGKTSRANGASLSVKLTYPAGPYDANIARVKVDLPKQLPSRLTTLQKACPAATFEANPANCPAASIIGHATATTPVMPVPLTGPAYFVSHGGEAFPSLIIVLQGYGATVHLVGTTFISKAGITSSTFKAIPDVPVGTFELTLPEGKYSALAANGNLCTSKLAMPTSFVGQNGAVLHTSTPITATGCAKHKKPKNKGKRKSKK
jgi:hypothetical protein